jgi:hypothetical protein
MKRRSRANTIQGQWRAHTIDMIESPAWRALSHVARKCLDRIEIELANHGGRDNGKLPVTYRDFADYGLGKPSIALGLAELIALGFVEMKPGYASSNPEHGRTSCFRVVFKQGRDGPPGEDRWRRFKTGLEAKAAIKKARAAINERREARRRMRKMKPLSSGFTTRPLSKVQNETTVQCQDETTIYSLGSDAPAAQSVAAELLAATGAKVAEAAAEEARATEAPRLAEPKKAEMAKLLGRSDLQLDRTERLQGDRQA